jgi:hypothetical protein
MDIDRNEFYLSSPVCQEKYDKISHFSRARRQHCTHARFTSHPSLLFAARMGLVVDCHELVDADLGVALGGGEGGMAEQFLNGTQVGTAIEEVCGEGMT